MVNGPPCAVCGFTLRWLPQQSSWGCDRCQRMFPASGPGAPQQQAAPQQPSPWAPPQQGQPPQPMQQPPAFQPPQQQGFGRPPQQPPYQPPAHGFQPPQQQGFGSQPGASRPASHPGAHAASQPGMQQSPYAPPNPYAQQQQPYGQQQPPYGQQQPPYSPQPQHPSVPPAAAAPAGAKKSGKGLIIGLAVAGVAIAGGVVAFVMMRGGGVAGGGSRSDVVKSTLAALGDGDVDQLLKLSAIPELYEKIADCKADPDLTDKDKEDRDPKKRIEKQKEALAPMAEITKGAKIELVEIVNKEPAAPKDDDTADEGDDLLKKGQEVSKGCHAKVTVRLHKAQLKLKVTPKGEKPIEQDAEMTLMQVGTGFYLAMPPAINAGTAALEKELGGIRDKVCACKDAECAEKLKMEFKAGPRSKSLKKQIKALSKEDRDKLEKYDDEIKACEKKLGGDDQMQAMEQFKDKLCACNDKACADKVTQEMGVWANSHKDGKLSEEDTERAGKIGDEMGKCVTRIYSQPDPNNGGGGGGGIGSTIASAGGLAEASADLPQMCKDYRQTLLDAANCPKLPQASRQALLDSWKSMAEAWKNFDFKTMPPESVRTIEDACKQGIDAMKQMSKTLGC